MFTLEKAPAMILTLIFVVKDTLLNNFQKILLVAYCLLKRYKPKSSILFNLNITLLAYLHALYLWLNLCEILFCFIKCMRERTGFHLFLLWGKEVPLSKNKFELNLASREKLQTRVVPCFAKYICMYIEPVSSRRERGDFSKEKKLI